MSRLLPRSARIDVKLLFNLGISFSSVPRCPSSSVSNNISFVLKLLLLLSIRASVFKFLCHYLSIFPFINLFLVFGPREIFVLGFIWLICLSLGHSETLSSSSLSLLSPFFFISLPGQMIINEDHRCCAS